ncbi:MAG: transcriptional regulator [Desulfovibrionaceae bacterium]
MWKWIILALAAYALYRLFANDIKKKQQKNDDIAEKERKVATGEMVKDPECGTYIDAESSITVRDGDTVHRFCSYECRDAFLKKLESGGRVLPQRAEKSE